MVDKPWAKPNESNPKYKMYITTSIDPRKNGGII